MPWCAGFWVASREGNKLLPAWPPLEPKMNCSFSGVSSAKRQSPCQVRPSAGHLNRGYDRPQAMEKTMFDVNAKLRRGILAAVVAVIPLALAGSAQAYQCKAFKTQAEALGNTAAAAKISARG